MARSKCRWKCPDQWSEWSDWLAAGLHARNRWRLPVLLGMLLASGRRTVTSWLRAAGVSVDYQDYYYFLARVGRNIKKIASQWVILILRTLPRSERVLLIIDDSRDAVTPMYRKLLIGLMTHRKFELIESNS